MIPASRLGSILSPPITEYVDLINLALLRHLKVSVMGVAYGPSHNHLLGALVPPCFASGQ